MSQDIISDYIFNKTAKQITFSDFQIIRLEGIKLITNVDTNTVIYQFNKVGKGGTVIDNVLTLDFDTSSMNDTDKLMIIYDDPKDNFYSRFANLLYQIVQYLRFPSYVRPTSTGDMVTALIDGQSTIGSCTTVSTVSTCSTVTNVTNLNTMDSREVIWNLWDIEFNAGIRSKIT